MKSTRLIPTILLAFSVFLTVPLSHAQAEGQSAADRFKIQTRWERHYERKLEKAFAKIAVEAVVLVSAQMDWTRTDRETKQLRQGPAVSEMNMSSGEKAESLRNYENHQELIVERRSAGVVDVFRVAVIIKRERGKALTEPLTEEQRIRYVMFIRLAVGSGLAPTEAAVFDAPF